MSKSKKFLAMCLVLMLVISVSGTAALAAGSVSRPNTTLFVGAMELPEEGEAILPIMISGNEGFIAINISLTFDHNLFNVVSVKRGSFANRGSVTANIESFNEGRSRTLNINMYNASGNLYSDGCIFEVTLQAKKGVEIGEYPVTITYDPDNTYYARDLNDINYGTEPNIIDLRLQDGNITVVHAWDEGVPVPSSCIEGTFDTKYTCTVCGATKIEYGLDAHHWELTSTVDPTCTENGARIFTCSDCGNTRTESIPALGHDFSEWTYSNEEVHVHRCSRCELEQRQVHEYDSVKTDPTCTEDGFTTYTCQDCGYSYTVAGEAATGHAFGDWESYNDNQHIRHCEKCDETELANHAFGDQIVVEPTCGEEGYTKQVCEACGQEKILETTPALGHNYGAWEPYDDEHHVHHCDRCDGDEYQDHTFGEGIKIEPSCTEVGYTQYTCDVCGHDRISDVIEALGHNYTAIQVVEPTKTEEGYTVYKCSRCGDTYYDDFIPPISILKGDVNDSKNVDNVDLVLLARYLVKLEKTLPRMDNANMDDNKVIDNKDLVTLAKKIVNM